MRYHVTIKSFANTNGDIHDEAVNTLDVTMQTHREAAEMVVRALDSAHQRFSMLPGFVIVGDKPAKELHFTVQALGRLLIAIDAVPMPQQRKPALRTNRRKLK